MADAPLVPLAADSLPEAMARLTPQLQSTLERLLASEGQSCGLSQQYLTALEGRGLLEIPVDPLTQGRRLCAAGCGHLWYGIPAPVREAYATWAAQWEEAGPASTPLPEAATEHPATVALATAAKRAVPPAPVPQYWARIMNPLYGSLELYGTRYDQGQLLTLRGDWGDERLIRLGYVEKAEGEKAYLHAQCGACQAWFLNEHFRDKHGQMRHRERFAAAGDLELGGGMAGPDGGAGFRDITGDAADRRQWSEYPPYLEKSKASQQA